MSLRRRLDLPIAVAVMAATAVVVIAGPAGATGAVTLYANPSGAGDVCSHTDPCSIDGAMDDAGSGDTIIVEPGQYGTPHAPLIGALQLASTDVTVRDAPGGAVPVINSDATVGLVLSTGSSLDGVTLNFSGTKAAFDVPAGATAAHVTVRSSTGNSTCVILGTLRDSLCVSTASGASAIVAQDLTTAVSVTLVNVTAESTSATGIGLNVQAGDETPGDGATLNLHATNVIAHGGMSDVQATASGDPTATATVTLSHSDFATTTTSSDQGTATVIGGATNVEAPPHFVNVAKGNYHELAGSPTVNAGTAEPKTDTDLDGRPRSLGSAPDIGAYELPQRPAVGRLATTGVAAKSAHLVVSVDPQGLPTSVHAVATHGHAHVTGVPVSAGSGRAARAVHLTIGGLTPRATYAVHIIATNSAGSTSSTTITFTTP
jgi:hypothetical protein